MFQSYTHSVNTEQRVARRESERQGEEMVEARVVNGMEVEMEFRLTEQTFPKKETR